MAIFENDENERLASANRLVHKKTNALGAQRNIIEEPFYAARTVTQNQVFSTEPTADANLAAPDYDDVDFQDGEVGSRYGISAGVVTPIALHSYTPSGLVGAESAQTFFAVAAPPVDNGTPALEDKRIYPLIGPEFSPLRATAAEASGTVRGFELALYPAKTTSGVGTALEADTSNGPIPASADPGGASGADDGGYWSVDYDSGVVRLSRAMLHGSTGVFNPNEVYADLAGLEQTTGAPMLFAVYYRYTGNVGFAQDQNFVTVGDGYVSFGSFTGVSANTMQSAIDSLPDVGGTVYVKEGTYDYVVPVNLRGGIRVLGLGGVKITRPRTQPAFVIGEDTRGVVDGYQVLDSIEVYPRDGVNSGGAVELRSNAASQDNRQVTISNNVLYAEDDAPAITFGPEHNCSYIGLTIHENTFKSGSPGPVYIGERDRGGNVVATDMRITGNDFQLSDTSTSTALSITGSVITGISDILISGNGMVSSDISLAPGTNIERARILNNNMSGLVISNDMQACTLSDNIFASAVSLAGLWKVTISGNTGNESAFTLDVTGLASGVVFANNNIERTVTFSSAITDTSFTGNKFSWNVVFGSTIDLSSLSGNYFTGNATVASKITHTTVCGNVFGATFTSTGLFDKSVFSSNKINSAANFGGTVTSTITSNYFDNNLTIDRGASETALDNSVLADNKVDGTTSIGTTITGTFDYALRDSTVAGNVFAALICGKSGRTASTTSHLNSAVTGNAIGTISMHGQMEKTAFTGNKTSSAVFADIYKSTISGNSFTGSFTSEFVELSVIDSNYIASTTTVGGALNTSITGNSFGNNITITKSATTNALESSVFSDNTMAVGTIKFGDTITSVTSGNALKDSVVSGNSLVTFTCGNPGRNAGTETYVNSIVTDNIATGAVILYGKTQDSSISGNIFQSTFTTGKIEASTVSENRVTGAASIYGIYASSVTDGYFGDTLDIDPGSSDNALEESSFTGNFVLGAVVLAGSIHTSQGMALVDSAIEGNVFRNTVVCANSSRINAASTYQRTIIADNLFYQGFTIYGTCWKSAITSNLFGHSDKIGPVNLDAIKKSIISSNSFEADVIIEGLEDSTISGNNFFGDLSVDADTTTGHGVNRTLFDGNNVAGNTGFGLSITSASMYAVLDSSITNNRFSGTAVVSTWALAIGNIGRSAGDISLNKSILSNNNIRYDIIVRGKIESSLLSDNYLKDMHIEANIEHVSITGNYTEENLTITSSAIDSIVSDNRVLGVFGHSGGKSRVIYSNNLATTNSAFVSISGHLDVSGDTYPALELIPNSTRAAISISPQAQPSSHIIGDAYVSSTTGMLSQYTEYGLSSPSCVFYSMSSAKIESFNGVSTEQTILNALTIPANTLKLGQVLKINMSGQVTSMTDAGTCQVRINIGSGVLFDSTADSGTGSITSITSLSIQTLGGSEPQHGTGIDDRIDSGLSVGGVIVSGPGMDTTSAQDITVSVQFSATGGGNNFELRSFSIEMSG